MDQRSVYKEEVDWLEERGSPEAHLAETCLALVMEDDAAAVEARALAQPKNKV